MNRTLSGIATLLLLTSTLVSSPAQASQTVNCSTSGSFTIVNNVVTAHTVCTGTATFPDAVTSIADYSFLNATAVTALVFGPGSQLTTIGLGAFLGATSLPAIAIPDSVTTIGQQSFQGATALSSVTFGPASQLTTIGVGAFLGATSLPAIAIPDSVTTIGQQSFQGATALSSVTFGPASQLTTIGVGAFLGATSLPAIAIPDSVTTIGQQSFQDATALTSVTFGPASQLTSIGLGAFLGATSLPTIAIPDSVTLIGSQAFQNATSLTSITFGPNSSLNTIGGNAFRSAASLRSITFPATLAAIGDDAFRSATAFVGAIFLGPPPTVGSTVFSGVGANAGALVHRSYVGSGAGQFGNVGSAWNGLVVEVPSPTLSLNSVGSVTTQTVEFGLAPTNPQLTRSGFTLAGWSSTQGSAATFAADLSDFTMGPTAQTLFAVWEEDPVEVPSSSVTTASEEVAHPFSGPLLHKVDRRVFNADESSTITFQGKRLHRIESVKIDGVALEVISKSRDRLTIALPALPSGSHTLVIQSKSGKLTLGRFIAVK